MSVNQMPDGMFVQEHPVRAVGARFHFEGECWFVVAGYQRRFHCPVEGLSDWMECDKEDAAIIIRNRSRGWEVREVFVVEESD